MSQTVTYTCITVLLEFVIYMHAAIIQDNANKVYNRLVFSVISANFLTLRYSNESRSSQQRQELHPGSPGGL